MKWRSRNNNQIVIVCSLRVAPHTHQMQWKSFMSYSSWIANEEEPSSLYEWFIFTLNCPRNHLLVSFNFLFGSLCCWMAWANTNPSTLSHFSVVYNKILMAMIIEKYVSHSPTLVPSLSSRWKVFYHSQWHFFINKHE
jgi:hypothetical protein